MAGGVLCSGQRPVCAYTEANTKRQGSGNRYAERNAHTNHRHTETFLCAAVAAYNLAPGSLWAKSPNHLVLRRPDNRKWFAWIMDLPRATLGLSGEGRVDLPDLKCADPLLRDLLRSRAGYLPAYHMNRAGWIGLLLDGSLPLEEVLALLQKSYEAAGSKAARRIADGPRTVPHCLAHALREDG